MIDLDTAADLPAIDVSAPRRLGLDFGTGFGPTPAMDRRSFEERYAELGFGLGTVARKTRRDDAFWETPGGILLLLAGILAVGWLLAAAT